MSRYPQSSITAKRGINHVRATVEGAGSLFIKVEQDSDLGIDGIIELLERGNPLNQQVAVQIKSGQSYYDSEAGECLFPIGCHREYWTEHTLPVYGIVFVPTLMTAHWVNIKCYLRAHPDASMIRFAISEANRFDGDSFPNIFCPSVTQNAPTLSVDDAFRLIRSTKLDEAYLAIVVLFRRYPNTPRVWDEFVDFLRKRAADQIPPLLIYFLAHIPGHQDIAYFGELLSPETRAYARSMLSELEYPHVIKLLSLIDRENSICRGSIGQSVEAIISSLPGCGAMLRRATRDAGIDPFARECAGLILAMNEGRAAAPVLTELISSGSSYAAQILKHLEEWGCINPYA